MGQRAVRLRGIALAAASIFALSACTGGASPSPSPTDAPSAPPATGSGEPSAPASEDPKAARDAVCEAAKEEGELTYWSNFANPDPIFEAFAEAYPGIEVTDLANHPDDFVQALLTELTAGRPPTPDIMYGELNVLLPLFELEADDDSIDWRSLGVKDELLTDLGNVVRLSRVAGGIVYNTSNHSADELPDTWDELLDDQWDQQIVVDPRGRPFDQMSLAWGHDETIDYVNRLN